MSEYRIFFLPNKISTHINEKETLLNAAQKVGIYINSICGGEGVCGKCKLIVKKGQINSNSTTFLNEDELKNGYVLACQTYPKSDVEVEIPLETRLEGGKILTGSTTEQTSYLSTFSGQKYEILPLTTKMYLEIEPPSILDNTSDFQRLIKEIRKQRDIPLIDMGLKSIRWLPNILRQSDWKVTVTLGNRVKSGEEILLVEPYDTTYKHYGIAVDIGTTTIVSYLIDLNNGNTINIQACYNSQIQYGDDIISRLIYSEEKGGLKRLHELVINDINKLISQSVEETNINIHDITAVMCAGNTTMTHFLLELDGYYIRREPYVPVLNLVPVIRAETIGIKINPRGILGCLPMVGSYVGGDITAGVLYTGIADSEDISMLIDIGTNGEIVLGNKEWLVCCSASAGPAFEGGGIKYGMRASIGAIEEIKINQDYSIDFKVIGNVPPRGICGSGLIDIISEMLKAGIIDKRGKINPDLDKDKIKKNDEGFEYIIVKSEKTGINQDITITQGDIENLKRTKAAIFASIKVMLLSIGLELDSIKNIYIAGGFGNHLNIKKAIEIGMLPDISPEKYHFVGNSSINGTKITLLSQIAISKVRAIARSMTYIELMTDNTFMDEFVGAMFFPHTDMSLFPSLIKN